MNPPNLLNGSGDFLFEGILFKSNLNVDNILLVLGSRNISQKNYQSNLYLCLMKNTYLILALTSLAQWANAQNALFIPPTLSGTNFNLNLQAGTKSFLSGQATNTYGINGTYLGPTLILEQGNTVTLNVTNNLTDTSTMHWHGMHVAPQHDGGPHTPILAGTTWSPQFEVLNEAATLWYHPHLHHKTNEQVTKGAAGMIIVHDAIESALALPRTYGTDDFPIIVQSKAFDANNQIITDHRTAADSTMMVNGTLNPVLDVPAQVVRLRLLNASTDRTYQFGFSNNASFYQIATEGGLIAEPLALTRIRIAPGERTEILLNLNAQQGQSFYLMSYASELTGGIIGALHVGDNLAFIAGYSDNPLNGQDFNILQFNVVAPTSNAITTIPTTLKPFTPWDEADVTNVRALSFAPISSMPDAAVHGPFTMGNQLYDMAVINQNVPLNATEIWRFNNQTLIAHPFHLHDVQFYVLRRGGGPAYDYEQGWKDVVLVEPQENVQIIAKFTNFANPDVPYMYHCHLLNHEDMGMMGQFIVYDPSATVEVANNTVLNISPNPVSDGVLNIQYNAALEEVTIADLTGRIVLNKAFGNGQIDISALNTGTYVVTLKGQNILLSGKIIVQ